MPATPLTLNDLMWAYFQAGAPGTSGGINVQGTSAAGTTDSGNGVKVSGVYNATQPTYTTGQRADLQTDARGNLRIVQNGFNTLNTNQISVGTTATLIAAARVGRGSIKITNLGSTDIFIGNVGVTTTTGDLLLGVKGSSITVPGTMAIYGIVGTGTVSVAFSEVY